MRLIRYKRTIPHTTSGEAMFVSPTHEATGPSTSTPIRLASKDSGLNISLSTVATSTARKAQRLLRREREKSILIIFLIVMFKMFKTNAHNLKLSEFIMYKNLIT